ncbi:type II toxin-antitoxin system HicB family antitoxin [Nocardia neocaledoniensis]|jgi:predicted HicB family RNase H-like nuclease|uniref:type II toxin-antitoxin system HicB family antitoxin n=1 Tax=Nocardia neocaledoniensis TaxID=236511 RepID=UPI0024552C90|nr:toxin-antitoxin system HicB family antitoxin [Nocardia neocaledoniensis]
MYDLSNLPDPTHYAYRVLWSAPDGEYVALCAEFPSLSWLAETQEAAIEGLRILVADTVKDLAVNGEHIPPPLSEQSYSGRFLVRTTSELHARLAREAKELKVSLNQLINQRLSAR